MRNKQLAVLLVSLLAISFQAYSQIRDYVPVVRPRYHEETVSFLNKLSDSMKKEGYVQAAEILASYAMGGFGSGFVHVGPDGANYVITNRHVISQAASVTVEFEKADESRVVYENCRVFAIDEALDMAIVALPKGAKPLKSGIALSVAPIGDGMEVWSAGFPGLGGRPSWQLGKGNVTNSKAKIPELADPELTVLIQHSAQIDPGNSGGPLLVPDKASPSGYKCVGINTWKAVDRQAANFSIPAAAVETFFSKALAASTAAAAHGAAIESRCRAFIDACASPDGDYKDLARFIAYDYVARDGEAMFKDVLAIASTKEREDILGVFSTVSPIEGLRLAIAYGIAENLKVSGEAASLRFVAVGGNPESTAQSIPVGFSLAGRELSLAWVREHGIWRLSRFPDLAAGKDKAADARRTEESGVTIVSPYNASFRAGADLHVGSTHAPFYGVGVLLVPGDFFGFGGSIGMSKGKLAAAYGYSNDYAIIRLSGSFRAQLPLCFDAASLIPFVGVDGGMMLDMSMSGSGAMGLFSVLEVGLEAGLGPRPTVLVEATTRFVWHAPSTLVPPAALGLRVSFVK